MHRWSDHGIASLNLKFSTMKTEISIQTVDPLHDSMALLNNKKE